MNIEVEIKIKVEDLNKIKEKLPQLGKVVKSINQIDEYYIPCHRDFFAQKPHPVEWLRIRTNPDKVIFEYDKSINKRPDGLQDYAEEYETEIKNIGEFRKILGFLDFKKIITVDKQREYWNCGDFEICLDKVKDLGDFVEVEAQGNFKDTKEAKEKCGEFLELLGIENYKDKEIKKGYSVMLLSSK
ncbi:unnamed protein product [marine sediment metagenome]|uniref:CYTH domain-containing protein n=1 Tax=marine sediment metagenome TaxID=412755 RepID=X0SUB0_9ZZZZ